MRICWRRVGIASALFLLASLVLAVEIEIDVFASMAGKCSTLKIADRDFSCTSVAFSHSPGGRSGFTVPLNDPDDDSHIITFSGANGKRGLDDVYELTIDQVLLRSKYNPKEDGLPTPSVEPSTGKCRQVGNLATQHVSGVSCTASDSKGTKYELQFESDGSPIRVKTIRVADPEAEAQRERMVAAHIEQLKCRHAADVQGVLPRDRAEFILRCMDE
jgi:hypothetical protein